MKPLAGSRGMPSLLKVSMCGKASWCVDTLSCVLSSCCSVRSRKARGPLLSYLSQILATVVQVIASGIIKGISWQCLRECLQS